MTDEVSASERTRARLVEAAREVFAEHGFQGATVREICRRADANVAAVNYHFGSKHGLLSEALNFNRLKALQSATEESEASPEMRLRMFIQDFMLMLLDENNASRQCQMMARELADHTPALDKIVIEEIAPLHEFMGRLVKEIAGKKMRDVDVRRSVYSILGQCLFYRNSHPVLQRMNPALHYDRKEIEAIARHIADFSLLALQARG